MWVSVKGEGTGTGAGSHRLLHLASGASVGSSSVRAPETHQYFSRCDVQPDVNRLSGGAGALRLLGSADREILPEVTLHMRVQAGAHVWLERAAGGKGAGASRTGTGRPEQRAHGFSCQDGQSLSRGRDGASIAYLSSS